MFQNFLDIVVDQMVHAFTRRRRFREGLYGAAADDLVMDSVLVAVLLGVGVGGAVEEAVGALGGVVLLVADADGILFSRGMGGGPGFLCIG